MPLTDAQKAYVRKHYNRLNDREIADRLGVHRQRVQRYRHTSGLRGGACADYTDRERQILERHYPSTAHNKLLEMLPGRTWQAIKMKARKMGLRRRNTKQYTPGIVSEETPEGRVTVVRTGGSRYAMIHTPGGSFYYHRWRWEREVGTIPEGHVLRCKTSETTNAEPSNWELISRADLARENHDAEKAMATMEARGNHAPSQLTDNFIAGILAQGDPQAKQRLLTGQRSLIRLARANYKLKREIKRQSNE